MNAPSEPSLENAATLRRFITRIAQGIYIASAEGHVTDGNPALLEIFGADSVHQLQQYRFEDLVPDARARAERRRILAERGWLRDYEYEIRRLDGTRRRVRDTVFTQRDDDGRTVALHGILADVTPFVGDADGNLRERLGTNPLASFFTGAPAGLAIVDRELKFLRVNRTLAQMHHLPVEDHLSRQLGEVVPGLAPTLQPVLERVIETGRPALDFEVTVAEPTVSVEVRHWRYSCFALGVPEEASTAVGMIVVDVTDARRAEHQVRSDREYLAAMIESSPLAMVALDLQDRVVSINRAFERLFRLSRTEATGKDIDELIVPESEISHARAVTRRTRSGETVRSEGRRQRGDGTSVDVAIYTAPIVLGGRQIGTYASYEELSSRSGR